MIEPAQEPAADAILERRSPKPFPPRRENSARGFEATGVWIFDLDNTLYPAACNLFAEVDRRMGEFIARLLEVPDLEAHELRKSYYHQFGTTLAGLMRVHGVAPRPFLDYVHDIDLSAVPEDPALAKAIAALPGRRLIFTNGSRRHAERVAEKLGVLHLFEGICDIAACDYRPKPSPEAFDHMVRQHGVTPTAAAMFEDMPQNLEVPHALGMTTVLVVHSCGTNHPAQLEALAWRELPPHIHHRTGDLRRFLQDLPRSRGVE